MRETLGDWCSICSIGATFALTLVLGFERTVQAETNAVPKTQVVLLGTGTPNADPDRSGPAVAIVVNGTPYLVDCGSGVVRRAVAAARKNGIPALQVTKLQKVFITQLH